MDTATQALLGAVVGQAGFSPIDWDAGRWDGVRSAAWCPDLDVLAVASPTGRGPSSGSTGASPTPCGSGRWWARSSATRIWRLHARRPRGAAGEPGCPRGAARVDGPLHPGAPDPPAPGPLHDLRHPASWRPSPAHRFALNGVAIIDPFYSVVLAGGARSRALRLRRRPRRAPGARPMASLADLHRAYLLLRLALERGGANGTWNDLLANRQGATGIRGARTYPTILQPWLPAGGGAYPGRGARGPPYPLPAGPRGLGQLPPGRLPIPLVDKLRRHARGLPLRLVRHGRDPSPGWSRDANATLGGDRRPPLRPARRAGPRPLGHPRHLRPERSPARARWSATSRNRTDRAEPDPPRACGGRPWATSTGTVSPTS